VENRIVSLWNYGILVGRISGNSKTFGQFFRVWATEVLLHFTIINDVYFVILKKNSSKKQHITSFEQAISINQKIQRTTLAISFLYQSYQRWHRTRRKSCTIIYLSSQKYVIPKAKNFTCIGKYLIVNETYCWTYPTNNKK
jgi:hypothetical protein